MRRVVIVAVALISGTLCLAEDVKYPDRSLAKNEGYLLLDLLLERSVSEIVLSPRQARRTNVRKAHRPDVKLGPYEEGRHLALIPMREGWYRWTSTAVPHFDLPYEMNTSDDERWRFSITKQRTNYVGQLVVRKERSSDAVSIDLLTRIATTHESLTKFFASELEQYPIRYGGYLRDRFFEVYYPEPMESSR